MGLACALMVASGFAGLAYQIVWTQQSTSWLGHESAAVLAVVAAFFGGLALGALTLGSRIERTARPARWYAACEIAIGVWSLALIALLDPASNALLTLLGPQPTPVWHWFVAFFGTLVLLLPATMAMGATLPAMERVFAATSLRNVSISALYAANTAGAVLGVLAAAFWLVPQLGLMRSGIFCAALNVACALAALRLQAHEASNAAVTEGAQPRPDRSMLWLLAATGLLGIGYEVLVVRALSQIAENTVYTFALLLAVYLIGTALGAAIHARWLTNYGAQPEISPGQSRLGEATNKGAAASLIGGDDTSASSGARLQNMLLQTLAAACLLGTVLLAGADAVKGWILGALGSSVASALIGEAAIAALAFLLPTIVMGALFSHLSTRARDGGISFGRAIGINTLGAAVAPLLFGVVLLPITGLKPTLILVSAGYLLLVARPAWKQPSHWAMLAAAASCLVWAPSLLNTHVPDGGKLVSHIEGVMASVSVIEDASGVATLHINNRQQEGSTATLLADARQALLPIFLHPSPKRALFLGLGTGLTASSATLHPALQADAVELVPEVIAAATDFASSYADGADLTRLHTMSADARRFVRTSSEQYDVIVADNFHPARSGSASLYTIEHFESVRERLGEDGVFCQWLPLHQLDLDTLRSIVRSYLSVFPQGAALLSTYSLDTPTIGLISHRNDQHFDLDQVRAQLATANADQLARFGITDDLALFGAFVAGPRALAKFAGAASLNTDDRPIVAYRAPTITYSPTSAARDRLIELLSEVDITPAELLTGTAQSEWSAKLAAYWTARNRFIEAGRDVRPSSNVHDMIEQVREPLLAVLRISPDFRPAYDPLFRMALALGRENPEAARALLLELQQIQPDREDARRALAELLAN
ncbi:MAG TPA: fused MFS/spermidine synthase [Steroidobacter sp.]|uniref:fused MFS/spermidine synthase n=1 Tax=Steroidobacter sp. TaxID=1978227 RepID=UPI002EDAF264